MTDDNSVASSLKDFRDDLLEFLLPNDGEKELPFVIGAGLGRTGTSSLLAALTELGYKPLHMRSIMKKEVSNPQLWFDWARAKRNKEEVEAKELGITLAKQIIADGYTATTDFPACLLYKELLEVEPDARIILSIRDNGEKWADSVLATIGATGPIRINKVPFRFDKSIQTFYATVYPLLWEEIGVAPLGTLDCTKPLDRDALIKAHDDWINRVKTTVSKKKLLIHKSSDGFEPICKHLGIPRNDWPEEYPHLNDTESVKKMLDAWKMQNLIWRILIAVVIAVVSTGVVLYILDYL